LRMPARVLMLVRVRRHAIAVCFLATTSLSSLSLSGCTRSPDEASNVSFFNRGWTDGGDDWDASFTYRFYLIENREGKPKYPKDGRAILIQNKVGHWIQRLGYFEKKSGTSSEGEVIITRQQDDAKLTVRYRLYDCKKKSFDVCADVKGFDDGPSGYLSVKKNTTDATTGISDGAIVSSDLSLPSDDPSSPLGGGRR